MKPIMLDQRDKETLKVLKHNQNLSDANKKRIDALRNNVEKTIKYNNQFDKNVIERYNIEIPNREISTAKIILPRYNTKLLTWEELVEEAEQAIPYDVSFEDILSTEEFENALKRIDDIKTEFTEKTKLKRIDFVFLITAVALQCVRQYVLNPLLKKNRPGHKESDEMFNKDKKKPVERNQRWYLPTSEEILINPVPFDTTFGSKVQCPGLGDNHRCRTLGHDPILGWLFGTMNIVTSTMTLVDFRSFHVKTGADTIGRKKDKITNKARTDLVVHYSAERLLRKGKQGKIDVAVSLGKEAFHLLTDAGSKKSLPIPLISTLISPEFAIQLSEYGIDMASVTNEAVYASLINALVGMTHGMMYFTDKTQCDRKQYEVRTRKIILYSNIIASTSNAIAALILKNPKILDIGGLLVTISRLFSDIRFISRVKQEFLESELADQFNGTLDEIDKLYNGYFIATQI